MYPKWLSFRKLVMTSVQLSIGSNSQMKTVIFSSYLVPIQSKSMTIRVSYDIKKDSSDDITWYLRLVVLIRCSTRLVTASASWRHFLVLSVVPRWLNSCTSQSRLSVFFGFQQLFNGLSNNKSKRISRGSLFVVLPAKRTPARLL